MNGLLQCDYREKILAVVNDINTKFIERDELSRILILTIFAKEHIYLVGEPGTGKTDIVSCIVSMINGTSFWEKLLDTGTKKEELFGDAALNFSEIDKTETVLGNHYLFLDEVPRASTFILETLLMVMNERIYQYKGRKEKLPLMSIFGASNDLVRGERAEAFDDRFPIRYEVLRIQSKENSIRYSKGEFDKSRKLNETFTLEDIEYVQDNLSTIKTNQEFHEYYYLIKKRMIANNIRISDRKIGKAIRILRVSAFLNNRTETNNSDFFLLNHIFWSTFEDLPKIKIIIYELFFQNKDDIDRQFIIAEDKLKDVTAKINNDLGNFLKYNFSQNDFVKKIELQFLSIIDAGIPSVLSSLQHVYNLFAQIEDYKIKADKVLEEIKDNIFLMQITDDTFTNKVIERYSTNMKTTLELFKMIKMWKNSNKDYYSFQKNCIQCKK